MKSTYLNHFRLMKKYKIAVTFLTGYSGNFNVTNSNEKFFFTTSFSHIEPNLVSMLYLLAFMNWKASMLKSNEFVLTMGSSEKMIILLKYNPNFQHLDLA